jgi:hypothetical protein
MPCGKGTKTFYQPNVPTAHMKIVLLVPAGLMVGNIFLLPNRYAHGI